MLIVVVPGLKVVVNNTTGDQTRAHVGHHAAAVVLRGSGVAGDAAL
jgi:hypothetical protein